MDRKGVRREPPRQRSNIWGNVLAAAVLFLGGSYLITGSWLWGYKLPSAQRIKRKLMPDKELNLTPEELRQYDGTDPSKPIYLAVMGDVFDVTEGREYYGPGGGYSFFAGRDAGRAFVTGCFQTHLTPDVRGLSEGELKEIDNWRSFYQTHDKYFYVGKVHHPPIDPNSPIPEPCDQTTGGAVTTGNGKPVGSS
ncbi:hypothetical protein RI367_007459 [Sorochytrium milnesiophthora]